jgi:hypothetical protein
MANLQCIKGLDEFQRALSTFPQNIARNVLRGAVNAGATVLRNEAVALAPEYEGDDERVDKGLIKRAIYQKQIAELSNLYSQTFFVGVRRGKKSSVKIKGQRVIVDAYYWTWIEFGHYYVPPNTSDWMSQKTHRKAVKSSAGAIWVQPRSFMRPAFANAQGKAAQAVFDYFAKRIPVEAQKLGLEWKA